MSNPRTLISPHGKIYDMISRDAKSTGLRRVIFRGLVTYVDRLGAPDRPVFSIQAKVVGIDEPERTDNGRFFPPLLPIQMMSVPEVGEEILLICEEVGNINTAFWISRSNALNQLTKVDFGVSIAAEIDQDSQNSSAQYGYNGPKVTESQDESPDPQYDIPEPRVKPGDQVIQGRSNTFERHTFDTKNQKGVIEGITEEKAVPDDQFYQADFRATDGARKVQATLSDLDTQIIETINQLKFDPSYTAGTDPGTGGLSSAGYPTYDKPYSVDGIDTSTRAQNKYDTAYLLLEALELRIISRQGKNVQHTVLAEEQERWLIILINLIKNLIEDVNLFRSHVDTYRQNVDDFRSKSYEVHTHMAMGAPSSPPLTPALTQSQQTFGPALNTDHTNFGTDQSNLNTDEADFEKHKKPIPIHHSKTVAIN